MMMIICFFDCVMLMQLKNSVCISNQQGVVFGAATVCDLLFEKGIRIGLQQHHTKKHLRLKFCQLQLYAKLLQFAFQSKCL